MGKPGKKRVIKHLIIIRKNTVSPSKTYLNFFENVFASREETMFSRSGQTGKRCWEM